MLFPALMSPSSSVEILIPSSILRSRSTSRAGSDFDILGQIMLAKSKVTHQALHHVKLGFEATMDQALFVRQQPNSFDVVPFAHAVGGAIGVCAHIALWVSGKKHRWFRKSEIA